MAAEAAGSADTESAGDRTSRAPTAPRTAFAAMARHDWPTAHAELAPGAARGDLDGAGFEAFADACWWLGHIDDALAAYEAAHDRYLAAGDVARAAMSALLLGAHAAERGEQARGSAWVARARRLLADLPESAEHGYPLYWDLFAALGDGDHDGAMQRAAEMRAIGGRHGDQSLVALGVMGEGRTRIKAGDVDAGMRLLDEAMLMALSGELHPLWTGGIYCHLMDACVELQDLSRAGEWTDATRRWCDTVAEAVLYRGICRVHRAQVLGRRGTWEEAEREAARAATVIGLHVGTAAEAHYELGELARFRGDTDGAERSYFEAHALGRDPQPGLALLRSAQGRATEASASLRAALVSLGDDPLRRAPLCAALVDVALDAGEVEAARAAAAELQATADCFASPGLTASAAQAAGAVTLATSSDAAVHEALPHLRRALRTWQDLAAPYDAARCRVLLATAHRAIGDDATADLELAAARAAFTELGARIELARIPVRSTPPPAGGLTDREVEVLAAVAAGGTNRDVAEALFISEKTVARHLANIYTKLDVSSRAAASAWAVRNGLTGDDHRPPRS